MSYGKFRNFLVLLPEAKLTEVDPSIAWFEAATMVPFGADPFLVGVVLKRSWTEEQLGTGWTGPQNVESSYEIKTICQMLGRAWFLLRGSSTSKGLLGRFSSNCRQTR